MSNNASVLAQVGPDAENTPEFRASVGESIALLVANHDIGDKERELAHEIVERVSREADASVRAAIARHVAKYPLLPKAMAEELASDVLDV